jgi:hypothetical protein
VLTFWPYVWQLDHAHTYDEHLVLVLKTRCDTSRPPDHRVSNLCDRPRSSAPGLLLLPRSSSLYTMPHLPPSPRDKQTRFSERNKGKRKTKQNVPHLNSNLAKSMTHHNQTKELTTWFLSSSLSPSVLCLGSIWGALISPLIPFFLPRQHLIDG